MNWPDDYINKVICGDCLDVMKGIPDGAVDLVLTDPPYGSKQSLAFASRGRGIKELGGTITTNRDWPACYGDDREFDPTPLLRFRQIIMWGGQYYANQLPNSKGWLVWDKRNGVRSDDNADVELAWTNLKTPARIHHQLWKGICREGEENIAISGSKLHPFQKPVRLMKWCLGFLPDADIILDPFAGSGTTLVAAKQLGRKYIGIEINPDYCKIAEDRLRQMELFGEVV